MTQRNSRFISSIFTFFLVTLATFSHDAFGTDVPILRKTAGAYLFGPTSVYTPLTSGSANAIFFPMGDPIPVAAVPHAGFGYQITGDTGTCKLRGGVRFSNDGVFWGPYTYVYATYATVSEADPTYTPDVDLTGLLESPRALAQFGVLVETDTTDTRGFCQAILRVDPHPQ